MIINGAMQVAQRGTTQTTATSNAYHTVDRWIEEHASSINVDFAQVSGSAPSGFQKSLKCTAQSTATLGANDYIIPFEQRFERTQIDSIGLGTSEAKTFTLSFWIKSNRTGTYAVNPTLDAPTSTSGQSTTKQYTIDSVDTWEYKTITFPANTIASPNVGDNAKGFTLFWWMLAGSSFTSGSLPSGWKAEVANERAVGCNNTVSTGDYWQITGLQLEVGDTATPFEHRSYGDELAKCQRYYANYKATTDQSHMGFPYSGFASSSTRAELFGNHPVEMRVPPTISFNSGSAFRIAHASADIDTTAMSVDFVSTTSMRMRPTVSSGLSAGQGVGLLNKNSTLAIINFEAEL
jgi:hypothetical protein